MTKFAGNLIRYTLFLAVALSGAWQTARAGDGALLQNFGNGGKILLDLGGDEYVDDMAIQPDGKIVVFSESIAGNNLTELVMRYDAQGQPDATFGTNGRVAVTLLDYVECLAIQPDGKIVIAGGKYVNNVNNLVIVRLNANGSTDTSFGAGGVSQTTTVNGRGGFSEKIVFQTDGKIVVVGEAPIAYRDSDFFVARYNTDGTLDQTFGTGGSVTTSFGDGKDHPFAVLLQPDGKLLVAGEGKVNQYDVGFTLARYNPNGSLDQSFGVAGRVATVLDLGDNYDSIKYISLQPNGKILAVGSYYRTGSNLEKTVGIARYNSDGSLDQSFGTAGTMLIGFPHYMRLNAATEQPDGKILIVGRSAETVFAVGNFGIGRLNANGTVDQTFGTNGEVMTDFGAQDNAFTVALQRNGNIILGGGSGDYPQTNIAIAAYKNTLANIQRTPFDFDGDGRADVSVYRSGTWHLQQSATGYAALQFGLAGDKLAPADYDGDGRTDEAVYRDGVWHLLRSDSGYVSIQFGLSSDVPQAADYDGDGKAEISVYRPSNGAWYIYNFATNQVDIRQFGLAEDKAVAADFTGDGKAEICVFRPSSGVWYWLNLANGQTGAFQFGLSGDKPAVGDYDGDHKTDYAVYRNGTWYVQKSATADVLVTQLGTSSDVPVPADYDGDDKTDIAIFRPSNSTWYVQQSASGMMIQQFGSSNDVPVPNAFVP
jgi:uncharacterized delta-60 repeat protein